MESLGAVFLGTKLLNIVMLKDNDLNTTAPGEIYRFWTQNSSNTRKLGFGPEVIGNVQAVRGEDIVNSSERAIILGESLPDHQKEVKTDLNEETHTEEDKSSDELGLDHSLVILLNK
ncbi:unnamed protein product [Nezara viridula]|uniref:Uncharacterized protein n=1 Tax=Nezara viridula TaxID=85310 RepID=A0A9P0EBN6_NEZVI|nr:unnamed protein product [Nezara viridula]